MPTSWRPRLHAERVEQPVVVVRKAVALVNGDVELVGAFDQIEALDRERDLGVAVQPLGIHLFEIRVGAVAADAVGVEQPDAEDEIVGRLAARGRFRADRIASPEWNTNDG